MLLAVDVGNTNIVIGVFLKRRFVHFRLSTNLKATQDEYYIMLSNLLRLNDIGENADGAIVASVVPSVSERLVGAIKLLLGVTPIEVGAGIKTGMPIRYDSPKEVGADRIANAVGAYEEFKDALIVIDSGTAITFDVVSRKGEYIGGAIAPGISIAADALAMNTAKLPRVSLNFPVRVIGKTTVESIQSGIMFGYLSLIEGMVRKIVEEMGIKPKVVATGGEGIILYRHLDVVDAYRPYLTIFGLKTIYERNR